MAQDRPLRAAGRLDPPCAGTYSAPALTESPQ